MDKINFQNLPNTTTPVNATNLNQLQTNVEAEFTANKIETTTDTNGTAVKFANGTMICYGRFQFTSSNWNAWGSLYGTDVDVNIAFPVAFISVPRVTANLVYPGAGGIIGKIDISTRNKIDTVSVIRPSATTNMIVVDYHAIGRWK